jgi:hypothetical protein
MAVELMRCNDRNIFSLQKLQVLCFYVLLLNIILRHCSHAKELHEVHFEIIPLSVNLAVDAPTYLIYTVPLLIKTEKASVCDCSVEDVELHHKSSYNRCTIY